MKQANELDHFSRAKIGGVIRVKHSAGEVTCFINADTNAYTYPFGYLFTALKNNQQLGSISLYDMRITVLLLLK